MQNFIIELQIVSEQIAKSSFLFDTKPTIEQGAEIRKSIEILLLSIAHHSLNHEVQNIKSYAEFLQNPSAKHQETKALY
jgi:hypothetical protein